VILLADPDPDSRNRLVGVLVHAGHDVRAVATGTEVVQVLVETSPRLIILDLDLKWVSGRHLIDFLKRNDLLARIPIVALANLDSAPSGVPTLCRPANPMELLRLVDSMALGPHEPIGYRPAHE
jgi:CheY-like chemotaxis protein